MKFSKSSIKHATKKLVNDKECIVRSFFGIIPHPDFHSEKVNGALSFFKEPQCRKFFNDIGCKDIPPVMKCVADSMESLLADAYHNKYDEECFLIVIKKELSESYTLNVKDMAHLYDHLSDMTDAIMIVITHFLPYSAVEQYEECSRSKYNISFSNKYAFKGYDFLATLTLTASAMPSHFNKASCEKHEQEMIKIRDKLKSKFDILETQTVDGHWQSHTCMVSGFKIYFNDLSRINIIKLINVAEKFNITITSSLKGLGMTKE